MAGIAHPQFAHPVRETRLCLAGSQALRAAKLGASFQIINLGMNRWIKPLPVALKQIDYLRHAMGEAGQDLCIHFLA